MAESTFEKLEDMLRETVQDMITDFLDEYFMDIGDVEGGERKIDVEVFGIGECGQIFLIRYKGQALGSITHFRDEFITSYYYRPTFAESKSNHNH